METYSLYELNQFIRQVFTLNFQEQIWVQAEIAQCRSSKGHYYLELVEKSNDTDQIIAQSSAVIWAGDYLQIKKQIGEDIHAILQSGSEVQVLVEVDYHVRYGLKLLIRNVDVNYSLGRLEVKRREILDQLKKEHLIDLNKSLSLPIVIQKIAVISSETAAGYKDFMHQLLENSFGYSFHCDFFAASMQGANVSVDITRQLRLMEKEDYDCVIIIRGGGSRLDLADFDDYELAKRIALSRLPVLTGIGHEIDTSIADLVAHTSLKTPTAVAEFILNRNRNFEEEIFGYHQTILKLVQKSIRDRIVELTGIEKSIKIQTGFLLEKRKQELLQFRKEIKYTTGLLIERQQLNLEFLSEKLAALDFRNILRRGYTITYKNGRIVRSVKDLQAEDIINHLFLDGTITTRINKIKQYGEEKS